jgi:hypothetical protein
MGLDVYIVGALIGVLPYIAACRVLNTWFPDGSERPEGGERRG